jgi:hypothetical protein
MRSVFDYELSEREIGTTSITVQSSTITNEDKDDNHCESNLFEQRQENST